MATTKGVTIIVCVIFATALMATCTYGTNGDSQELRGELLQDQAAVAVAVNNPTTRRLLQLPDYGPGCDELKGRSTQICSRETLEGETYEVATRAGDTD
jgi:hypothetical protein